MHGATTSDGSSSDSLACIPPREWNLFNSNTEKAFWGWTTTQMTWNPNSYEMILSQNGHFLASKKIPNPIWRGGWVGIHGYCGANMATHDIREFRLTIHNNPDAKPVGPYPTDSDGSQAMLESDVVHRDPGFHGTPPTQEDIEQHLAEQRPPISWWKFW
jgi:hypothetical protein